MNLLLQYIRAQFVIEKKDLIVSLNLFMRKLKNWRLNNKKLLF